MVLDIMMDTKYILQEYFIENIENHWVMLRHRFSCTLDLDSGQAYRQLLLVGCKEFRLNIRTEI